MTYISKYDWTLYERPLIVGSCLNSEVMGKETIMAHFIQKQFEAFPEALDRAVDFLSAMSWNQS